MNLIWQFHMDINRPGYDGTHRREMALCSSIQAALYAARDGAAYEFCEESKWHARGIRGGPAMERFQLMEERYDKYDYILYLDTDILIHPLAKSLFSAVTDVSTNVDIAAVNWCHRYDRDLLEKGWLATIEDKQRYLDSAIQGGIILMSRNFRQWFRENCDPEEIAVDVGKKWPQDMSTLRWPVYDQSLMSYYIYRSPFKLLNLNQREFMDRNQVVHIHGRKEPKQVAQYFAKFGEFASAWATHLAMESVSNVGADASVPAP